MDPIIQIQNLSYRYGKKFEAIKDLSLEVAEGSIYAFLGTNGAGKTTTIKTLLNLLQPSSGTVKVFGVDSVKLSPLEKAQIGYVSENQQLPEKLTVKQVIEYCRTMYPTWDEALCSKLIGKLTLPENKPLAQFSRGMKMKAALLLALSFRPRLLVMDEPFSGLDPVVRDDIVQGILELSDEGNWTVFISSHDVDEVDRLADWVGMIEAGQMICSEPTETLRSRYRRVDVIFDGEPTFFKNLNHQVLPEISGQTMRWIEENYSDEEDYGRWLKEWVPQCKAWAATPLSLKELFVAKTRALRSL